jgi:hypothetical protein
MTARRRLPIGGACLLQAVILAAPLVLPPVAPVAAQEGALQSAPTPPLRPFDMDMPAVRPNIVTPPKPVDPPSPAAVGMQVAPAPPQRPASLPPRPASANVDMPDDAPAASPFAGFSFPGITTPAVPPVPSPDVPPTAPAKPEPPQRASVETPKQDAPKDERQWPFRLPWQRDDPAETAPVDDTPTGPGITTDPGISIDCLPPRLKTVLNKLAAKYGSVRVTSTYRPAWRARRGSYHRRCEAVDFRVPGHRPGEVMGHIRDWEEVGGRKVYWNGLLHVDIGPVRSW